MKTDENEIGSTVAENSDRFARVELTPFADFLKAIGRSPVTGWRWRKRGWVRVVDIAGRLYISMEEIALFRKRALKGDFASGVVRN